MTVKCGNAPTLLEDRIEDVPLAQLLRQVAASDQTAFTLLYDAMSGQVQRQVRAALSADDAVDAVDAMVAATFLQVWWLAPLHDPDDVDVPAWIAAIASGLIADRRRVAPLNRPADDEPARQRSAWPVLSSAYDETVAVVLAGLLGRRGPQKAF